MRRTWLLILVLDLAMAACASEDKKRHDIQTNLRSWEATVRAVAEQWSTRHAPDRYSKAALDRAKQGVEQELAGLPPDRDSDALRTRGSRIVTLAAEVRAAIERGDPAGLGATLAR